MEARNYAVFFELNAGTASLDYTRSGSHKQVLYGGPFNVARNSILEYGREGLSLLAVHASKYKGAC